MSLTYQHALTSLPMTRVEKAGGVSADEARLLATKYDDLAQATLDGNGMEAYVSFCSTDGDRFAAEWEGFWDCAVAAEDPELIAKFCRRQAEDLRALADDLDRAQPGGIGLKVGMKLVDCPPVLPAYSGTNPFRLTG